MAERAVVSKFSLLIMLAQAGIAGAGVALALLGLLNLPFLSFAAVDVAAFNGIMRIALELFAIGGGILGVVLRLLVFK